MKSGLNVSFHPSRATGRVPSGVTIAEAARMLGLAFEAPCAGAGTCGRCLVQVRRGISLETVLGCLATVDSDLEVILPSLDMGPVQTVEAFRAVTGRAALPDVTSAGRAGLGVALDLGTTTLVAALVDLASGSVVRRSSILNPLVACGHDVLSRIHYARTHARGLRRMQRDLVKAVNLLVERLANEAGVPSTTVKRLVAAGNTTMQHLFLGLPVAGLGEYPYSAATLGACAKAARGIGLRVAPAAPVTTLPSMSTYVGGDIVAGLLAIGTEAIERPALFLDIGTNGEIVLLAREGIMAASTAAGPCFEGMTIRCGMRAAEGAIQHVEIADKLTLDVIGGGPPRGICGSGLLDVVAELRRTGIMSAQGRLAAPNGVRRCAGLRGRLFQEDGRRRFLLGGDVFLAQDDIRQVQLAKAAIRAGVEVLLGEAAIRTADLRTVLVAGAFGYHARESSILGVGLLPEDVRGRLAFIGNASLAGATRVLLDDALLAEADRIARSTRVVDLSATAAFPTVFRDRMAL